MYVRKCCTDPAPRCYRALQLASLREVSIYSQQIVMPTGERYYYFTNTFVLIPAHSFMQWSTYTDCAFICAGAPFPIIEGPGPTITQTPLPAALLMFAAGLGLFGWMVRRRNTQRKQAQPETPPEFR